MTLDTELMRFRKMLQRAIGDRNATPTLPDLIATASDIEDIPDAHALVHEVATAYDVEPQVALAWLRGADFYNTEVE